MVKVRWMLCSFSQKCLHLGTNLAILSHTMKDDEGFDSYRLTRVYGSHYSPAVVRFVFCFFISPSLHRQRQGGATVVSQHWLIRGSTPGRKGLKLANASNKHTKVGNRKKDANHLIKHIIS